MNKKQQTFFAILAGIITMCLVGLILFPALKWIIIKNLHLFEKSSALNDFVIYGSSFLWVAVSSFFGGLVTAFAVPDRNIFYSLITGVISFALVICFSFYQQAGFNLPGLLSGIEVIIFSLIGGMVQRKITLKKYKTV